MAPTTHPIRVARALTRLIRLSESGRWLIIETSFYLRCAEIATFTTPTRTLLARGDLVLCSGARAVHVAALPVEIAPAIHTLDKSSRRLAFSSCLIRALALRMILASRDIYTNLHIGAH